MFTCGSSGRGRDSSKDLETKRPRDQKTKRPPTKMDGEDGESASSVCGLGSFGLLVFWSLVSSSSFWSFVSSSMLDPKLIRETPDVVRAAIARKHLDVDLDGVLAIDTSWRTQLQEVESLRSKQKAANNAMAALAKGSPEFTAKVG